LDTRLRERWLGNLPPEIPKGWCCETDVFEYVYLSFVKLEIDGELYSEVEVLHRRGCCRRLLAMLRRVILLVVGVSL
jgi:hypothetical protein